MVSHLLRSFIISGFAVLFAGSLCAKDEESKRDQRRVERIEAREDLRAATQTAIEIVKHSNFSKTEAADSLKTIARYAYTKRVLKRNLLNIESQADRRSYQRKFQNNIRKTTKSLTEAAGQSASRKFKHFIKAGEEELLQASSDETSANAG